MLCSPAHTYCHTKASERILKKVIEKEYIFKASEAGMNKIYESYQNLHSGPTSAECKELDSEYDEFLGHIEYFVEEPLNKVEQSALHNPTKVRSTRIVEEPVLVPKLTLTLTLTGTETLSWRACPSPETWRSSSSRCPP